MWGEENLSYIFTLHYWLGQSGVKHIKIHTSLFHQPSVGSKQLCLVKYQILYNFLSKIGFFTYFFFYVTQFLWSPSDAKDALLAAAT